MTDAVHTRACTGTVTVQNRTHADMNFSYHKDLGNHLLHLFPKAVTHPVYIYVYTYIVTIHYN
jgi:hypothetical protein